MAAVSYARMTSSRRAGLVRYLAAGLIVVLAIVGWLHGVVEHPGSRIAGDYGDGTGVIRDYWAESAQHRSPLDFTHDALNGAPEGTSVSPATAFADAGMQTVFMWSMTPVLGIVGAWNAFLLLGLFASGTAMFALLDRLRCSFTAAMFGSLVFAFSPYVVAHTYGGHSGFVHNWTLVVVLATLLRWSTRRTPAWSAAVGAAIGLAFYVSAYEGFLASVMALVFFGIELVRSREGRLTTAAHGALAYIVTGACLIPVVALFASERSAFRTAARRPASDLHTYAASVWAYLVPSPHNPLLRRIGGPVGSLLGHHPVDLTEKSLFVGYTTIVLAVVAVVLLARRDRRLFEPEARGRAGLFAAALVPVALLLSLAPTYRPAGITIPTPSWALAHVTTYLRVLARFGELVGMALVILAALALTALAGRRGRWWKALPAVALLLVALELLPGNAPVVDSSFTPQWVKWLAAAPRGIVVTYPMQGAGAGPLDDQDFWYQRLYGDPRFAMSGESTAGFLSRARAVRFLARDIEDPATPGILSAEGVRYVVLHDDVYRAGGKASPTPDSRFYRLLARFGDVRIFAVHAPPADVGRALTKNREIIAELEGFSPPTVAYVSGFYPPEPFNATTGRWQGADGQLELGSTSDAMRVRFTGLAFSNAVPRLLEVEDGSGRVVARQLIPTYAVPLKLGPVPVPTGNSKLTLVTVPGPDPMGASDPRTTSVFLSNLAAEPIPAYAGT
jgi:hypothetical protein